jgi:hypothetical protein
LDATGRAMMSRSCGSFSGHALFSSWRLLLQLWRSASTISQRHNMILLLHPTPPAQATTCMS